MQTVSRRALLAAAMLATSVALAISGQSGEAKIKFPACYSGKCGIEKPTEVDATTQGLIWKIAHRPELMNLQYLQYVIGRPNNELGQEGMPNRHYYWYDRNQQVRYELIQADTETGKNTESTMVFHFPDTGLTLDRVHERFGTMSRRFFDYSGRPSELFSFAPDTYLAFSSPKNAFKLQDAKIIYRGKPLPAPDISEMNLAKAAMIARGMSEDASPEEALALLKARAKEHPLDGEAHYALAQALRKRSLLHDAIGEYKVSLALSGTNHDLRSRAVSALTELGIIHDPNAHTERRNMELVQHGQRIRVQGEEKKSKKDKSLSASAQPQY